MTSNTEGLPVALGAGVTVAAAAAAADEAADILLHAHAHALNRMRRHVRTVAWTVASSFGGPGKTQIMPASVRACLVASEWRSRWVGSRAHTTTQRLRLRSFRTAHRLRTVKVCNTRVRTPLLCTRAAKHQQRLSRIHTRGPYTCMYSSTCTYKCIDLSLMCTRASP